MYPSIGDAFRHSDPSLDKAGHKGSTSVNALTIKASAKRGVEDVPFRLNPAVQSTLTKDQVSVI